MFLFLIQLFIFSYISFLFFLWTVLTFWMFQKISNGVKERLDLCKKTGKELSSLVRKFKSLAIFSRIIFESVCELRLINHMYQYSLSVFLSVYTATIKRLWVLFENYICYRFLLGGKGIFYGVIKSRCLERGHDWGKE